MSKDKTIWKFFITNYKVTYIIIIASVILGFYSIVSLPKEANPEVDIPVAVVMTGYPGANAEDVELSITNVIEDQLVNLNHVDIIQSSSSKGMSTITVQFDVDADSMEQITDLKDKVDVAKPDLPDDATDPIVTKIRLDDMPILTLAFSGPFEREQLKEYANIIKEEIENVNGVSNVQVYGGQEREIQVLIDKTVLDTYGLSISQVTQAISRANSEIPIGTIESADEAFNVRMQGQIDDPKQIEDVPITTANGIPIFVKDIATIQDGYSELISISRLSLNNQPVLPSVSLRIYKVSGGDVINIIKQIETKIEKAQQTLLPETIVIETVEDNGEYIKQQLSDLLVNGLETVLIVIVVLLLFLGLREALIASLVVPLSYLISFIFVMAFGYTLNVLTLFSLLLALGILVDCSIVITESVHNKILGKNKPKQAVLMTLKEFRMPLIAGTMTTVLAFLPMLLMGGIMGEFIEVIPITVVIVLLSSLFVSLGLITTLSYRLFQKFKIKPNKKKNIVQKYFLNLRENYSQSLNSYLKSSRKRKFLITIIIIAFVLSMMLPAMGILKVNMFPSEDADTIFINIEKPIGTTLNETDKLLNQIEELLYQDAEIKSFSVTIGASSSAGSFVDASSSDGYLANIIVNLTETRTHKSTQVIDRYQDKLKQIVEQPDTFSIMQTSVGPGDAAPVLIKIFGDDLITLENLSYEFVNLLENINGTINIYSSVKQTNGEFVIHIDRTKAQMYGVTTSDVAMALRNAVYGMEATEINYQGQDIDVIVKYTLDPLTQDKAKTNITNITNIESLTIATPEGDIPLAAFTDSNLENSRSVISHDDHERMVSVSCYTQQGIAPTQVFAAVQEKIDSIYIPDGYEIKMGGEQEDIDQSYNDLYRAFFLAVFLILGLLVWQFKSYRQPLFVILSIPFSLIGVFPGLVLVGQTMSLPGLIGVVALAGIVVNNAIILIDRINNNINEGQEKSKAIVEAAESRLQPILLTTITTITGILPLAVGNAIWGPLGFSIVFGLLFSTILTLYVIPVVYFKFSEKKK